jgi:hypothetical protein
MVRRTLAALMTLVVGVAYATSAGAGASAASGEASWHAAADAALSASSARGEPRAGRRSEGQARRLLGAPPPALLVEPAAERLGLSLSLLPDTSHLGRPLSSRAVAILGPRGPPQLPSA